MKNNILYPDYNNCIVNLSQSILKEFNIDCDNTLKMCDKILKDNYTNIILLVLDGMGKSIIEKNLDKNGFFNSHLIDNYSSVFPPTTVAATTSFKSGKYPVSHAWLGWDCYFKEIDKNITVFKNAESETRTPFTEFDVANTFIPYDSIVDKINKNNGYAYYATPFEEPYPKDFDEICNLIQHICNGNDNKKFIYSYYTEPDTIMHHHGPYSQEAKDILVILEEQVKELCKNLKDTLVIVTADHGQIESNNKCLKDYPKIMDCLVRMPSIEPRAINFFIKDNMKEVFVNEFNKHFKDSFILMTKEEVINSNLFGTGSMHKNFIDMIGDYLAISLGDITIFNDEEEAKEFIGVHAGLTEDEMLIPFIAISTDNNE